MAPEQAEGNRVTWEADVYSLALSLYEAWTGVNPVRAGSPMGTARRLGTVLPPLRSRRRDLPVELGDAIDRALDPDPERRPTVRQLKAALDSAGLRCQSAHMGFERLRDDAPGAFAEAKALGASWVVCPWITHDKEFTRDDALKAAEAFNKFASAADAAGLRFAYHCHGYEMLPSPEGTRFDTLAQNTDPKRVSFQVDVFHALHGGANPVDLINRYASRVTSLHLKDLKKGVAITKGTGTAPADVDVPLGTGQVDWPPVLRAAMKAGTLLYYVEDESADPWGHIPQSVQYLKSLKL